MTDMVMAAERPRLRVGNVLERSLVVLLRDFGKFFLLSAIAWSPSLLVSIATRFMVQPNGFSAGRIIAGSWWAVVWITVSVLGQAVMLYGAFQQMRGKSFAIGQSLKRGLARFFPLIGVMVCSSLAVGLASLLFIVPGIMLMLMWYVAIPACVVEGLGPLASLGRSRALTKGSRWRIFGLFLLILMLNWIVQSIAQFGLAAVAPGVAAAIVGFLIEAPASAFSAITTAVLYHDLRVVREGVDIERIAAVFD